MNVEAATTTGTFPASAAQTRPLFPIYVLVGHDGESDGVPVYKCGYIDQSGTVVVQPQYRYAGEYSDGLALVETAKRRWAFIDTSGRVVFSVEHDFVAWFREGLAAVLDMKTENDPNSYRAGFINLSGQIAIPMTFRAAGAFSEGLVEIHPVGKDADKFGYIDKSGRLTVEPRFKMASSFSEGLAAVHEVMADGGTKSGYIDQTGKYVIILKEQRPLIGSFHEGLAAVVHGGSICYIDKVGTEAIPRHYQSGGSFHEGLAWVRLPGAEGGKCGYISRAGHLVVEARYDQARDFSEGLAGVRIGEQWGFIDRTGKIAIAPRYSKVGQFKNGLGIVEWRSQKPDTVLTTGYITKSGEVVWKTPNECPCGFFAGPDDLD